MKTLPPFLFVTVDPVDTSAPSLDLLSALPKHRSDDEKSAKGQTLGILQGNPRGNRVLGVIAIIQLRSLYSYSQIIKEGVKWCLLVVDDVLDLCLFDPVNTQVSRHVNRHCTSACSSVVQLL